MLHPKKGEGEHSKKYNKRRKAPQIALTVLIFSTPFCMAQSALATTSFGLSGLQQPPVQQQKVLQTQGYNYQLQNRQTRYSSLTPIISEADITALQNTLAQYKGKLSQLSQKDLLDPALKPQLDRAIQSLNTKIDSLEAQITKAISNLATYNKAKQTLSKALTDYTSAQQETATIQARFSTATTTYQEKAQATLDAKTLADASLTTLSLVKQDTLVKREALSSADASLTTQLEITNNALITFNNAKLLTAQATEVLQSAQQELDQAEQDLATKLLAKQTAQHNYNTLLIPDPTWTAPTQQVQHTRQVPHTELVPHTTTETTYSANILPALDSTIWTGAGTGFQGSQPTINQGVVKFSYMSQSVTYTKQENLQGSLTLSVDVKNQDANRGQQDTYKVELFTYDSNNQQNGYAVYNSPQGWHDWTQVQVSVDPTSPVTKYKVVLTGFDGGYWYGTYGPEMKNPTLSASTTITTTTYEEVTTYTEETYYTTEPVLIEGTINVQINEGQSKTFTAPEGAVFKTSNLRYEAKDRPECGVDIKPKLQGNQITISALNSVWGDPCGGWYKHIVGTLSYLGQPTAPLIKDPALLPALNNAITNYDLALSNKSQKQELYNSAQEDLDTLQEKHKTAESIYEEAVSEKESREATKAGAWNNLSNAIEQEGLAETEHNSKTSALTSAQAEEAFASQNLATEEANYQGALDKESVALATKTQAEASLEEATSPLEIQINTDISFTDLETILDTPAPVEEKGSPDIPKDLSAENLMDVDLTAVDPTELTEAQAEQLVEAALETFETATEGSPEYEQALDALFLAAQQDDIVVDEALANIPGVGQAAVAIANVLNLVGNVGADISPKAREKAQTLVVTTLVVGQIAQTAALATASSGGSFRRKQ